MTSRENLMNVKNSLKSSGYTIESANLIYRPKNYVEDEDIEVVYNNADISDSLWQEAREKVEASRFRT